MTRTQRLEFLLQELKDVVRLNNKEKVIYIDFDLQLTPVNIHDISELKAVYKYRVQYEIPCQ